MAHETITREEFDQRLAQSTKQMHQKRLALEAQQAKVEQLSHLERTLSEIETELDHSRKAR